ncbi:MAG: nuclear transport factor 2 family protein [Silvibacterium sp.]
MRCRFSAALFLGLLMLAGCHRSRNDIETITDTEQAWSHSYVTGDAAVSDRIMADDFIGVDVDGSHYDKQAMKDIVAAASKRIATIATVGVNVRVYGDAAVAQGYDQWKDRDGSGGSAAWSDTWVRRNGKWRLVAAADILLPKK